MSAVSTRLSELLQKELQPVPGIGGVGRHGALLPDPSATFNVASGEVEHHAAATPERAEEPAEPAEPDPAVSVFAQTLQRYIDRTMKRFV